MQQTGDHFHIEVKPQHSGEGKAGTSNKRGAHTVIQMRPAKRLKMSPLQAEQSSDANMANGTDEREEKEEKELEGAGGAEAAGGGGEAVGVGGHLCLILRA